MALRASGDRSHWTEIDRFPGGVGWMAYPDEGLQRASHVLATDAGAVIVDPLDVPDLEDLLTAWDVLGVTVLMTHHTRDAAQIAQRLDVPLYLPAWIDYSPGADVVVKSCPEMLGPTEFEIIETVGFPWWHEAALYDGETLVVADLLGTAPHFVARDEELGMHALLRLWRPDALRSVSPDRVLVGHGRGIMDNGTDALESAYASARSNLPWVWANGLQTVLTA